MKKLILINFLLLAIFFNSKGQNYKLIIGDTTGMVLQHYFTTPYELDLDNNGVVDYIIEFKSYQQTPGENFESVVARTTGLNELCWWEWYQGAVDAINQGDTLFIDGRWGKGNEFWFNARFYNEAHQLIQVGAWSDQTKYMGIRLSDGVDTLYGWVNLTIGPFGSNNFHINETAIQSGMLNTVNNTKFFKNRVKVFPNPTNKFVEIESKNAQIQNIEIYDIYGKKLSNVIANKNKQSNKLKLDISSLQKGVYFIKTQTTQGNTVKKIIKN